MRSINYLNMVYESWKSGFNNKKFVTEFILTIFIIIFSLIYYSNFLNYVETRQGVVFHDPILDSINPVNLTLPIFIILYTLLLTGILLLLRNPAQFVMAVQIYILIIFIRIIAMYLTPLDSPNDSITLSDPVVTYLGTGRQLTKDLFFSGHTATLFILFLTALSKTEKAIFISGTIIIGFFVIVQHIHYAIDVFAAPFFVYGAYRIIVVIKK